MNNFGKTSLFDKVIPKTDSSSPYDSYKTDLQQCDDHKSYSIFRQGIFDVSGFSTDKYWEINNFFEEENPFYQGKKNKDVIGKIECYLLKHPLFNFPIFFYPLFQFVHHSQIGFKFIDKDGRTMRHMTIQLQNSWYPVTSETVPFDLPQTCKRVEFTADGSNLNVSNKNEDVMVILNDKTAIYADFLEKDSYTDNVIIEMNKYTYFRGINLDYLKDTVNFNFFLESYRMWRSINTNGLGYYSSSNMKIPDIVNTLEKTKCSTSPDGKCGGDGDGSLFVFNTFSPSFISQNEGCILHFADIKSDSDNGLNLSSRFLDFMKWTYSNLYCSKTPETYIHSFTRHYITLSTSLLNYNWAINQVNDTNTLLTTKKIDHLFNKLRNGTWLNSKGWDTNSSSSTYDEGCEVFDALMTSVANSNSLTQPNTSNGADSLNSVVTPFLCQGDNYTCEIFSRYIVSMIVSNSEEWSSDNSGVSIDKKFDFNISNQVKEGQMTFVDNLYRSYTMYWPVAVYDSGYENGVSETEFNMNPKFNDDKIMYAKQAQLFKYLFKGQFIEAAKTANNPFMMVIADFLGLPLFNDLISAVTSGSTQAGYTTAMSAVSGLLYALFLYKFLGVQEVFITGYPVRKLTVDPSTNDVATDIKYKGYDQYNTEYQCEPSIYKFQIGTKSKAAIANNKCIEAYFNWIQQGESPTPIFPTIEDNDSDAVKRIKQDLQDAYNKIKETVLGSSSYISPEEKCKNMVINNPLDKGSPLADFRPMCEDIYSMANTMKTVGNVVDAGKDILDIMLVVAKNPSEIPKFLVTEFANFLGKFGNKLYIILTKFMRRFTTLCHQDYTFAPQIMYQMNNASSYNNSYKFPDFNRPSNSICGNLICNIGENTKTKRMLVTTDHNIKRKLFSADYKIIDPYKLKAVETNKNKDFHITVFVCFILVISVLMYMMYKKRSI